MILLSFAVINKRRENAISKQLATYIICCVIVTILARCQSRPTDAGSSTKMVNLPSRGRWSTRPTLAASRLTPEIMPIKVLETQYASTAYFNAIRPILPLSSAWRRPVAIPVN